MENKHSSQAFEAVIETVRKLRAPGGCPWDRAQTHQTLRPYLIEETYEVLDVLDQIVSDDDVRRRDIHEPLCEELGDLLLQILLHSQMASEKNAFDIHQVAQGLNAKLIRRHPHVFGEAHAKDAAEALQNWERLKSQEKESKTNPGVLSGVPKQLPALQRAFRVIEKVTRVGFQWPDLNGPLQKAQEEFDELRAAIESKDPKQIESELGDVLFTLCNLGFLKGVDAETALRGTLSRFESRFRHVELRAREKGSPLETLPLTEMDRYWDEAKSIERQNKA